MTNKVLEYTGEIDNGIYGRTPRSTWVRATDFDALQREVEGLRADAARYRWLREYCVGGSLSRESNLSFSFKTKIGMDASISQKMTPDAEVHETETEANARRYVWLVDIGPSNFPFPPYVNGCPSRNELDAAIDAALRTAKREEG